MSLHRQYQTNLEQLLPQKRKGRGSHLNYLVSLENEQNNLSLPDVSSTTTRQKHGPVLDNTVPRNEDVETSDEVGSSENSCDNSAGNVFAIRNDGVSSEEQNDLFGKRKQKYRNAKNRTQTSKWRLYYQPTNKPEIFQCQLPFLSTRNGKPHQQIINAAKSPTNLKRHIERWHPSEFREMNEAQKLGHTLETVAKKHIHTAKSSQVGIARFFHKAQEVAPNLTRGKLKLLLWAIEHSIAFSALDDDMFRGALEEFGVGVQSIPNRKQLVQEYLPLLSVLMHNMVDSKLQNASTVSITTDGWNNIRQQRFISITAHFIDDEWNLQKNVLEVAKVSEEHSGENIYNFLKVHLNHHLPKNCLISSVTSDNGKNFMSASHKLVGNDSVSCLAHTIQLCINDVIQNGQWAEDIECVQQIVTKVK